MTLNALVAKKVYCWMIGGEQFVDGSSPGCTEGLAYVGGEEDQEIAYDGRSAPGCVDHELMPSTLFEAEGKCVGRCS